MIATRIVTGLALITVRGIDAQWLFSVSAFGYARLLAVDGRQLFASGGYRLIVHRKDLYNRAGKHVGFVWEFACGAPLPGHMARVLEATYQEVVDV